MERIVKAIQEEINTQTHNLLSPHKTSLPSYFTCPFLNSRLTKQACVGLHEAEQKHFSTLRDFHTYMPKYHIECLNCELAKKHANDLKRALTDEEVKSARIERYSRHIAFLSKVLEEVNLFQE